ncbi:MAG TPA: hypothetical protein VK209_13020 [Candidatus Sulfotelmatobacter sp.]|nr:hypothetical protein [Candidatus Sulfotelmatobacter sp.]
MHIAQIGTGRVGRPTAYTIMSAGLADTLTLCDVKPNLSAAFAQELNHVKASLGLDVEINACDRDQDVTNADIILISAGKPRTPGIQMSRRDLAIQNAKIVREISEATAHNNPDAKYIVITNPVDAMAMVCKKYTKASFVIGTGTNLESLRFRHALSDSLNVPISQIQGWVGGEHGDNAVILWSTTRIFNQPIDEFLKAEHKSLSKDKIASYVKSVSKLIVDNIGGTEYGPAASFRDIVRAIVKNTDEVLSIATPMKIQGIPEPTFVGTPTQIGKMIGRSLYTSLDSNEQKGIIEAAKIINQTYTMAAQNIE